MTLAIWLACLFVIYAAGGFLMWASVKALKANRAIYQIRVNEIRARTSSTTSSPTPPHRRKLIRGVIASYVVLLAAGFLAGILLSTGSAGKRLGFGVVGTLAAMLLVGLGAVVHRVILAVRAAVRGPIR